MRFHIVIITGWAEEVPEVDVADLFTAVDMAEVCATRYLQVTVYEELDRVATWYKGAMIPSVKL